MTPDPMHAQQAGASHDVLVHALTTALGSLLHAEQTAVGTDVDRYRLAVREIEHALWPGAAA